MRMCIALSFALLLGACTSTDMTSLSSPPSSCASPDEFAESVVKITTRSGTASAIVTTPDEIITVAHVSSVLGLSEHWYAVSVSQLINPSRTWHVARSRLRIKHVIAASPEDIHVLEFAQPLAWHPRIARVRSTPLALGEHVIGIGYPNGSQVIVPGQHRIGGPFAPIFGNLTHFFFGTSKDGAWINKGASGGGIFDCTGSVVALISGGMPRLPYLHELFLLGLTNYHGVSTHQAATEVAR